MPDHEFVDTGSEKTTFIGPTAPGDWRVKIGTLWSDTTTPELKRCTSVSPITFTSTESGGPGGGDEITVNAAAITDGNLNDSTPAAPAGNVNVAWQKDGLSPANISAYVPEASTTVKGLAELATDGESGAGVVVQGNDSRLSDSRAPTGAAGGDLGGTYPNPTVDDGADSTAIHDNVAGEISLVTEKAAPVSADLVIMEDSAAANVKKRAQVGNLPVKAHDLGGAEHNADTLANLNLKISDATLDDSSASRPPSGAAGGDLGGTYPNPTVDDGADSTAIHDNVAAEISAITEKVAPVVGDLIIIEDSAAANVKKRAQLANLPAGTTTAKGIVELATDGESAANVVVQGNDARLSDSRAPTGAAGGDLGGTYPNPTVDDGADSTAIHDNVSAEINAITAKTAPVAADIYLMEDSAASNAKKKITHEDLLWNPHSEGCRVYRSTAQSIPDATLVAVLFDSERWDIGGLHSTVSLTTRITIQTAGKYIVGTTVSFEANATGIRLLALVKNGVTYYLDNTDNNVGASVAKVMCIEGILDLAASDYLQCVVYQSSGGSLNVNSIGNYSPEFYAIRVSD